jgi:hypothetical protein
MNFAGAMDGVFVGDAVFFANMSGIADLLLLALIAYCIVLINGIGRTLHFLHCALDFVGRDPLRKGQEGTG